MVNIYYEQVYFQNSLKRIYRFRLQILLPLIFIISLLIKNFLYILDGLQGIVPLFVLEVILGLVLLYWSVELERKAIKMNSLAQDLFIYSLRWLIRKNRRKNFKLVYLSVFLAILDADFVEITGNLPKSVFLAGVSLLEMILTLILPILIIWVTLINVISINYQELVSEADIDEDKRSDQSL